MTAFHEPGDQCNTHGYWTSIAEVGVGFLAEHEHTYRRKISEPTTPLANGYRLAAGYRWLATGDTLETGDEYHSGYDRWTITGFVGARVNEGQVYRRKLQPPTPKPPLGLTPRHIWIATRKAAVVDAIRRYLDAGTDVPAEWLEELIDLTVNK